MDNQLKDMIEEFLSEKRLSDGSNWAKPTTNDMSQLNDIIYELLLLKFERDANGDLPVKYLTVDKTEEDCPPYLPTRHTHKISGKREWLKILGDLNYNRLLADDRFQTAFRIFYLDNRGIE